jgi:hypothetical protein
MKKKIYLFILLINKRRIFTQVLPLMFQYVLDIELVVHEDNVHFYQYQI